MGKDKYGDEWDTDEYFVDFRCFDCGVNTVPERRPQEYYIVHDEIWLAAAMTKQSQRPSGDFLCIGCLEARLGRTLTRRDFPDCPANQLGDYLSSRLKARLLAM